MGGKTEGVDQSKLKNKLRWALIQGTDIFPRWDGDLNLAKRSGRDRSGKWTNVKNPAIQNVN